MGKKKNTRNRPNKNKNKINLKKNKPFVSICTPTFNRRPFIPQAIKYYLEQDYPKDKIEWIVIDDGTDPVDDLFESVPGVKYHRYEEKMTLGKKRNLMHKLSKGEIIVYMDDDDYYPPSRVSHAVEMLIRSKKCLIAGSSEVHVWFNDTTEMIKFGPYGPNHATAGTFAFKRELLDITSYDETACLAEEKHFLKGYTIPMVQLNPKQTILVFSHDHNTFDKRTLLKGKGTKHVNVSSYEIKDFIKSNDIITFYTQELRDTLSKYKPGEPEHKPDVIKQTQELKEKREKKALEQNKNAPIVVVDNSGNKRVLCNGEVKELLNKIKEQNIRSNMLINTLKQRIVSQDKTILDLQEQVMSLKREIEKNIESSGNNIELECEETIKLEIM